MRMGRPMQAAVAVAAATMASFSGVSVRERTLKPDPIPEIDLPSVRKKQFERGSGYAKARREKQKRRNRRR